ncbi:MAG: tRNA uridine(34) 5-carboxymethylaminomethyl modification radical SAM/GNAT enzyme Elp3, partial [Candidatus Gastranaerophilales bacterium]|nr:tRNA uridine(34) 5-carboxymethylaminomethyl modification radical SAM/GNAT enzyme Elp3 [Candidatus Gastranaerophilales bacterium]
MAKDAKTKEHALKIKRKLMKKYSIPKIIGDCEIYERTGIEAFKRKPSRKMSGVSVIAVMTSPEKCPHGKCVFCPGGIEQKTPQSYTGLEPA